jgi:hypothetical protein
MSLRSAFANADPGMRYPPIGAARGSYDMIARTMQNDQSATQETLDRIMPNRRPKRRLALFVPFQGAADRLLVKPLVVCALAALLD